ncbi:hypothetical protein ACLOJK_028887 [Asimina triloba]
MDGGGTDVDRCCWSEMRKKAAAIGISWVPVIGTAVGHEEEELAVFNGYRIQKGDSEGRRQICLLLSLMDDRRRGRNDRTSPEVGRRRRQPWLPLEEDDGAPKLVLRRLTEIGVPAINF